MFRDNKSEYQKRREENHKETSRERLRGVAQQKIKTTMIGAIASMEEHFSFLWKDDPAMKTIFERVRSEILDKGNTQIRNFDVEIANYDIVWKKYTMVLPVKRKE